MKLEDKVNIYSNCDDWYKWHTRGFEQEDFSGMRKKASMKDQFRPMTKSQNLPLEFG